MKKPIEKYTVMLKTKAGKLLYDPKIGPHKCPTDKDGCQGFAVNFIRARVVKYAEAIEDPEKAWKEAGGE